MQDRNQIKSAVRRAFASAPTPLAAIDQITDEWLADVKREIANAYVAGRVAESLDLPYEHTV